MRDALPGCRRVAHRGRTEVWYLSYYPHQGGRVQRNPWLARTQRGALPRAMWGEWSAPVQKMRNVRFACGFARRAAYAATVTASTAWTSSEILT